MAVRNKWKFDEKEALKALGYSDEFVEMCYQIDNTIKETQERIKSGREVIAAAEEQMTVLLAKEAAFKKMKQELFKLI